MNPYELHSFNAAVALAQNGQKAQAQAIFVDLGGKYPNDSNVLLWLAFTSNDLSRARACLDRVAVRDPANPALAAAWSWLISEEAKQMPTPPIISYAYQAQAAPQFSYSPATPSAQAQPGYSNSTYFSSTYGSSYDYEPTAPVPMQPQTWTKAELGPETAIVKPKKLTFFSAPVMLTLLLVGLLAFVLIAFIGPFGWLFGIDTVVAKGLPVYTNARRITLSEPDRAALLQTFQQGFGNSAGVVSKISCFEVYAIPQAERASALSYYDNEIKRQGWSAVPNGLRRGSVNIVAYRKDWLMFTLSGGSFMPDDKILGKAQYKVKPGDLVLMAVGVELDSLK